MPESVEALLLALYYLLSFSLYSLVLSTVGAIKNNRKGGPIAIFSFFTFVLKEEVNWLNNIETPL